MPTEPQDEDWAARCLSAEAERFDFDHAAFLARVMSDVHASITGEDAAARPGPHHGQLARRPRLTRGSVTGRIPRTVRSDPRPRAVPATLAAAAIVVIAVGGSIIPGMRAWSTADRLGVSRTAEGVPSSDAPSPTQTTRLGAHPPSLSAPTPPTTPPQSGSGLKAAIPSSFRWTSSEPLISAKPDADHAVTGIKDASVVYYQGKWHVFATATGGSAPTIVYLNFTDWANAGSATQYFLDKSPIGAGYRAAPQILYFAPQKLWYLVYQTGNAAYSTNPDINNPNGWSPPKDFYPDGMPDLIKQNKGNGYWVDMWVICDDTNCYLFSSDQQGHLYRSRTSLANFPNGMGQTVIALQDPNRLNLLNSTNVYKVAGTDQYLLIVEAVGSDGAGYLRSWTATGLAGSWTPLAATESHPFARSSNVAFPGNAWTKGISHGELVRDSYDQALSINPCRLRYLYHGQTYQLGLLTQNSSACS
jgi:endo-1,4-beta-xylanase